jgi:hypothetical protein
MGTSKQAETYEFAEEDRASGLTATSVRMGGSFDLDGDNADSPGDGVNFLSYRELKSFSDGPSDCC